VVVGSRIIEELERAPEGEETARVAALMGELRQGIRAAETRARES
jgi:tryptophan synthase alpha subunit